MIKVIINPDRQILSDLPEIPEDYFKKLLVDAGCDTYIDNYGNFEKNPFNQRVFLCHEIPKPSLMYGISWTEL